MSNADFDATSDEEQDELASFDFRLPLDGSELLLAQTGVEPLVLETAVAPAVAADKPLMAHAIAPAVAPEALAQARSPTVAPSAAAPVPAPAVSQAVTPADRPVDLLADLPAAAPAPATQGGREASSRLSVGMRVRVSPPVVPQEVRGMVASLGMASNMIATDNGEWLSVSPSEATSCVSREVTPPPADGLGVVAFSYDNTNKQVVGMLFGEENETVMEGAVNAYKAHIMKPVDRDTRLRQAKSGTEYTIQSFALGDVLEVLVDGGGGVRAPISTQGGDPSQVQHVAVVRVLYARRGNQQARRLLILHEVLGNEPPYSLPATKAFFPATWGGWTRAHQGVSSSHTQLPKNVIRDLNEVHPAMHSMSAL